MAKTSSISSFITAMALFFLLDFLIRIQIHPNPYNFTERSFIWWAVQDYRQLKQVPNIMLFGSSLMLAAVNEGDAAHYNKMVDTVTHHRSYYLEQLLTGRFDRPVSTFCFAIGGQMASDVYAIATNFIKPDFKPQLIIWGIAPRDLLDSAFSGAATSDTGRYMNKISGCDLLPNEHMTFNSIVDQCFRHVSFIYSKRLDFLSDLKQSLRNMQAENIIPAFRQENSNSAARATMIRQLMNPKDGSMGDIEVGECMIAANSDPSTELKDNTREYYLRYNPFKAKTFNTQVNYFQKFLLRQQQLGIKVVLVNMPLTKKNMDLLPPSSYQKYLYTVKKLATNYNADIVDLNNNSYFSTSDFFDTAHLNGLGSAKLLQIISARNEIKLPEYQVAAKAITPNL